MQWKVGRSVLALGNTLADCGGALQSLLRGGIDTEVQVRIVLAGDGAVGGALRVEADADLDALVFNIEVGLDMLRANQKVDGMAVVIAALYVVGVSQFGVIAGEVVKGNDAFGKGPVCGSLDAPAAKQAREETVT